MAECQSRRVKGLTRSRSFEQRGGLSTGAGDPSAATPGIHGITYDRVADVLEVNPDLVGTAGMQLEP
jgi:hypothetical protein